MLGRIVTASSLALLGFSQTTFAETNIVNEERFIEEINTQCSIVAKEGLTISLEVICGNGKSRVCTGHTVDGYFNCQNGGVTGLRNAINNALYEIVSESSNARSSRNITLPDNTFFCTQLDKMESGSVETSVRNLHVAMSQYGGDCNRLAGGGTFRVLQTWDNGRLHPFMALEDRSGKVFYVYTEGGL